MAPYDFQAPDADAILRSSDAKEFPVHKIILSLASPVFQGMFGLPQPTESPPQIPTIDASESSDIFEPFIQYLYPRSPPNVSDVAKWGDLYAVADKYQAEGVMESLRDMLLPKFLGTSPLRAYALASRWGLEEEAKTASRGTLTMDISKGFPEEDARLMGGDACQRLYLLHLNRREAVHALIVKHPHPSPIGSGCLCSTPLPVDFIPALCLRVGARPSVTLEEVYEVTTDRRVWPKRCGDGCHFSYGSTLKYCHSIAKKISELPLPTG